MSRWRMLPGSAHWFYRQMRIELRCRDHVRERLLSLYPSELSWRLLQGGPQFMPTSRLPLREYLRERDLPTSCIDPLAKAISRGRALKVRGAKCVSRLYSS